MKRIGISALMFMLAGLLAAWLPAPVYSEEDAEVAAVKHVIEEAYIKGIHINQDIDAIRKGFHPEFAMVMYQDGAISKLTIEEWIARIEEGKKKGDRPKVEIKHEFPMVEVSGNAAVARIELYRDGKHVFTDFMSLYKFPDGWKIMSKTYYRHA